MIGNRFGFSGFQMFPFLYNSSQVQCRSGSGVQDCLNRPFGKNVLDL